MSRKALVLFISASVIWGSSFLFIRVAVHYAAYLANSDGYEVELVADDP